MDVETKDARQLAGFANGRNTNPEFSADGNSLFFIGTPDGIANIYRMDVPTGNVAAITNVLSGVSGITQMTPALSVASKSDDLVFTAFEADKYDIYAVEGITHVPGRPVPTAAGPRRSCRRWTGCRGDVASTCSRRWKACPNRRSTRRRLQAEAAARRHVAADDRDRG